MNDIKNVCVYSASSTKIAKVYFDVAEELGRLLAEKKINLINGAGCIRCSIGCRRYGDGGNPSFYGGAGVAPYRADPID
jgi:hypothetical protein